MKEKRSDPIDDVGLVFYTNESRIYRAQLLYKKSGTPFQIFQQSCIGHGMNKKDAKESLLENYRQKLNKANTSYTRAIRKIVEDKQ